MVDEINLENGKVADSVTIPYSENNTVKYTYDSENKVYTRYSRGKNKQIGTLIKRLPPRIS